MDKRKTINLAAALVRKELGNEGTGHDWYHIERVRRVAKFIAQKEKGVDQFLVELIALMHDLDDWKFANERKSKKFIQTKKLLRQLQIGEKIEGKILDNIAKLSFRGSGKNVPPDLEGKIVQDADRLDALGAIGLARVFAVGGKWNRPIFDPKIKPRSHSSHPASLRGTSLNHIYEKVLKLKNKMNTKTAKIIAGKRHKFVEKFLREFFMEWEGKV